MTLGVSVLFLVLACAGIVAAAICLREKKTARAICMGVCIFIALACVAYIGLAVLLIDAIQNQPPTP